MNSFTITLQDSLYTVIPELHTGFYTIQTSDRQSAMIGKKENGDWEFVLETPGFIKESAEKIGEAIDAVNKKAKEGF